MASSGGSERFETLTIGDSRIDLPVLDEARHLTVKRVRGGVEEQTPRPSAEVSE